MRASAFAEASADRRSFSGGWSADRRSLGGGWLGGSWQKNATVGGMVRDLVVMAVFFLAMGCTRLATVDQQTIQMGKSALKLLLNIIDKRGTNHETKQKVVLDPLLICRESSAGKSK